MASLIVAYMCTILLIGVISLAFGDDDILNNIILILAMIIPAVAILATGYCTSLFIYGYAEIIENTECTAINTYDITKYSKESNNNVKAIKEDLKNNITQRPVASDSTKESKTQQAAMKKLNVTQSPHVSFSLLTCPKCGKKTKSDSKTCPFCGESFSKDENESTEE